MLPNNQLAPPKENPKTKSHRAQNQLLPVEGLILASTCHPLHSWQRTRRLSGAGYVPVTVTYKGAVYRLVTSLWVKDCSFC